MEGNGANEASREQERERGREAFLSRGIDTDKNLARAVKPLLESQGERERAGGGTGSVGAPFFSQLAKLSSVPIEPMIKVPH